MHFPAARPPATARLAFREWSGSTSLPVRRSLVPVYYASDEPRPAQLTASRRYIDDGKRLRLSQITSYTSVLSHEFALLYFESLAKIESAVAVQTNGFAAEL